jgi:hypothetical protein
MLLAGVATARVDPAMARTWLATAHQVVREIGGRVLSPVEPPSVGRNHYRVRIDIDGARLRLLLNASAALVAAADDEVPHALALAFRTVPRPDLFTAAGLHVAAPADLEQPLDQAHLTHLNADEQRDIAYHRPARIGDAIFNWFD